MLQNHSAAVKGRAPHDSDTHERQTLAAFCRVMDPKPPAMDPKPKRRDIGPKRKYADDAAFETANLAWLTKKAEHDAIMKRRKADKDKASSGDLDLDVPHPDAELWQAGQREVRARRLRLWEALWAWPATRAETWRFTITDHWSGQQAQPVACRILEIQSAWRQKLLRLPSCVHLRLRLLCTLLFYRNRRGVRLFRGDTVPRCRCGQCVADEHPGVLPGYCFFFGGDSV